MNLPSSLSKEDLRIVRADLKTRGLRLPKIGWSICLSNGARVCRDQHGYYLTGPFPGIQAPLPRGNLCS